MFDCPGDLLIHDEPGVGWVLVCDEPWTVVEGWWQLSIEEGATLAAAVLALWAVAWVFREMRRAA